jgi:hypothetical protein
VTQKKVREGEEIAIKRAMLKNAPFTLLMLINLERQYNIE